MIMLCCVFLVVEDNCEAVFRQMDEPSKPPTAPTHAEADGHESQNVKRSTWSSSRSFFKTSNSDA